MLVYSADWAGGVLLWRVFGGSDEIQQTSAAINSPVLCKTPFSLNLFITIRLSVKSTEIGCVHYLLI